MIRIILLLFSVGFFINYECIAQSDFRDGFIITNANDTIYGQVDYRTNSRNYLSCIFKKDNKIAELSPRQILGFGYANDKFFTSRVIEGSFVEALVIGDISLYKFNSYYLVRKYEDKILKLETKEISDHVDGKNVIKKDQRWKGILSYLISDCLPNSMSLVKDLSLDEQNLTKLIIKYNECKQSDFKDFKKNKLWFKIDLGASLGLVKSSIGIKTSSDQFSYLAKLYTSYSPSFGLIMAYSSPRLSEKLAIQPEIYLTPSNFSSLIKLNGTTTKYYDTYINMTTISVPISIKYSFPINKYYIFIQAGGVYEYNVKAKASLKSEIINNNVVNTLPESTAFDMKRNLAGIWGGIGVLKTFKRFNVSANFRYYEMMKLQETEGFSAELNRIALSIIIFKK